MRTRARGGWGEGREALGTPEGAAAMLGAPCALPVPAVSPALTFSVGQFTF